MAGIPWVFRGVFFCGECPLICNGLQGKCGKREKKCCHSPGFRHVPHVAARKAQPTNKPIAMKTSTPTITASEAFSRALRSLPTGCYHIRLVSPLGYTLEITRPSTGAFPARLEDSAVFLGRIDKGIIGDDYASDAAIAAFGVDRVDFLCNVWE